MPPGRHTGILLRHVACLISGCGRSSTTRGGSFIALVIGGPSEKGAGPVNHPGSHNIVLVAFVPTGYGCVLDLAQPFREPPVLGLRSLDLGLPFQPPPLAVTDQC